MDNFYHLSSTFMPSSTSVAYKLLQTLHDGKQHTTNELTNILSCSPRSALQSLGNNKHGYWLIHNLGNFKGIYQLDERHIVNNEEKDKEARAERKRTYTRKSLKLAVNESNRLPRATIKKQKAEEEYQLVLKLIPALTATNETKLGADKGNHQ